ncbi:MAG: alpha/beta hydrolase domain-containing protein, partial [Pseudomonadota bacterium]
PDNVRAYMISGTPHFAQPGATVAANPACTMPTNPNHAGAPMRALLTHLQAWVSGDRAPPPSQVPTIAAGTLVEAARALPAPVPGLPYTGIHVPAAESDHSVIPPRVIGRFPVYVPRMDGDGVAVAGIRIPVLEAPRESRTAWNPRAEGYGPGVLCPLQGGVVPLAPTRAAREAARDPRPSLEERPARGPALRAAAERLVAAGFLLPEDAARFSAE